jgi:hypothetical protein
MAAPGRVELYEPHGVFVVQNQFFEVLLSQLDNWAAVAVKGGSHVDQSKTRGKQ